MIPKMPSLHTPSIPGDSLLTLRIQLKVVLTRLGLRSPSSVCPANNNGSYHLLVVYDSSPIEHYKLWGPFIHIYHSSAFNALVQSQDVVRTKILYKFY